MIITLHLGLYAYGINMNYATRTLGRSLIYNEFCDNVVCSTSH